MKSMTPEERFERIERLVEFLASTQAQHDARLADISKQQAEIEKQQAENTRHIAEHTRQIGQLGDFVLRIGRIVEEQSRHMGEQSRRMDELRELQSNTEQRLNTLIGVVERYFSNGHQ